MMRSRFTKTDAKHWELEFCETMSRHHLDWVSNVVEEMQHHPRLCDEMEVPPATVNDFRFVFAPRCFCMSRYTRANHRIFMQFVRRNFRHVTFFGAGTANATAENADL
jgi:hypothetical protein